MPPCQIQLGMQNGQIPDSSLSASSVLTALDGSQNGRLHLQAGSGLNGAWRPATDDTDQWIQTDFTAEKQVTAVATQGRETGDYWVIMYTLSYSSDGQNFTNYQQEGVTKVTGPTFVVIGTPDTQSNSTTIIFTKFIIVSSFVCLFLSLLNLIYDSNTHNLRDLCLQFAFPQTPN